MGKSRDNRALLEALYARWHETKGGSIDDWLDQATDDVDARSLLDGRTGFGFTAQAKGKAQWHAYFKGLTGDWEMIRYKVVDMIVKVDKAAVLVDSAWRNRRTGKVAELSKCDLWRFRDGKICWFYEFYDTQKAMEAAS